MAAFIHLNLLIEHLSNSSAVVKIIAFFLVWVAAWLPIAVPLAIAVKWQPFQPLAIGQKLTFVLSLYAFAPLILWATDYVEKRSFETYGLAWNVSVLASLGVGLCLGVFGVGVLVGFEHWCGWLNGHQFDRSQLISALLPTLLLGLLVSVVEELVFRGFLLNQLQQEYSLWVAAVGSSLIFSLLHLVWEGREAGNQLLGLWLMGIVLVLARWADGGSLGLAWGLHTGWIWAMASLDAAGLMQYHDRSPMWLVGLAGKPLAGGMGLLLLLATGGMLLEF